jgi:peptidoglycan/LPS O-acetylase OafA/YrhL
MERTVEGSPESASRLPALDGLRGIAILLVMFHHFQIVALGGPVQTFFYDLSYFGPHGVDLFFVLSGFLITGILLDSRGHTHYFRNFYARRTLRIFPLYYTMIVLSLFVLPAIARAFPGIGAKLSQFPPVGGDWPWYVFFVSNILVAKTGEWRHPVLAAAWSLAIEEQFYVVWAVVVSFLDRSAVRKLALALVALSGIARAVGVAGGLDWKAVYVLTPFRFDALALGAFLAATLRGPEPAWEALGKPSAWIAFAGTPVLVCLYGGGIWWYDYPPTMSYGYTVVSLVCAAWLRLALEPLRYRRTAAALNNGVLRFFGKYSYAMYFLNLPLRSVLRDSVFGPRMQAVLGSGVLYQLAFDVAASVFVIPFALLSWKLIESPMLSLRRFFPRLESGLERRPGAPAAC